MSNAALFDDIPVAGGAPADLFGDLPVTAGGKAPTMRAYEPSIRDRIAALLMPDNPRESPIQARVAEALTGSRGMGRTQIGMFDLFPPAGALFAGDESNRAAKEGDTLGAMLNALGVIGPGAQAARAAVPAIEAVVAPKMLPPPPAVVAEARPVAAEAGRGFSALIDGAKAMPAVEEAVAAQPQRFAGLLNAAPVDDATTAAAPRFQNLVRSELAAPEAVAPQRFTSLVQQPAATVAEEAPAAATNRFAGLIRSSEAPAPAAVEQPLPDFRNVIRTAPVEPVAVSGSNAEQAAVGASRDAATAIAANPPAPTAPSVKIVTPDQSMEIAARPQVVELDTLRKAEGSFQPRDRSRAEYVQEARERATRLDPAQLGISRVSDSGAPIVLADGTVISGNGRTLSIAEAYADPALKAQADAYRASLGPEAAGMSKPVLVMQAEGLAGDDAARFADLSNRGRIAQMSATERAQRDARGIGEAIRLYQGGDFEAPQNAEFMRHFMEQVATRGERAALSKDGFLTQEGAARMRNAVLASAYDDAPTLSRMLESTDDNIRNLTGALTDAAPKFSALRADVKAGAVIPEMDATPQITDAVKLIADLRTRRVKPADFFAQKDAFGGTDPIVEAWVRAFYNDDLGRPLSREKMTAVLNAYADEAVKHRPGGLFPDDTTTKDVLNVAQRAKTAEAAEIPAGPGLFDAPSGNGQRAQEGGQAVSRPENAARGGQPGEPGGQAGDGREEAVARFKSLLSARTDAVIAYKARTGKAPPDDWPLSRIRNEIERLGAR